MGFLSIWPQPLLDQGSFQASLQVFSIKRKPILTVLQPPYQTLTFSNIPQAQFLFTIHVEPGLNLFNTCLHYLSKLIHHSCKTSDR